MKKTWLLLTALCGILYGAEFKVGNFAFDSQGGSLTAFAPLGKNMLLASSYNFTDQLLFADGNNQIVENFGKYDFEVTAHTDNSITFTTKGNFAFNWLRLTKSYTVDKNDTLKVVYTLQNLDTKPHSAGFWTKTFLRRDDGNNLANTYYQAQKGQLVPIVHPGPAANSDCFSLEPGLATVAVAGADNFGVAISLPPQHLDALYSWFSNTKDVSTDEWFLKEIPLPGAGQADFSITLTPSTNIPEMLKTIPLLPVQKNDAKRTLLPRHYTGQLKDVKIVFSTESVLPKSQSYMDVTGARQYNDSVRAARIPANVDLSKLGIYEIANGVECTDRPVQYQIYKLASGEQQVRFLVPGMHKRGFYYTNFKNGYIYEESKKTIFHGKTHFAYRLCFDMPSKPLDNSDKRLDGGPNIIFNGDFEQVDENMPWAAGYFWSYSARERNIYHWVMESQDGGHCMKITYPKGSRHTPADNIFFQPENGVKYTASAIAKCINPDNTWSALQLYFYNEDKKEIRPQLISLYSGKVSYNWTKYEKSFYAPENMVYAAFNFYMASSPAEQLFFDKVSIVPDDFTYVRKTRREMMRDELIASRYQELDFLENISHDIVTPHIEWAMNPADKMPKLLYMPLATTRSIQCPERRQIVEFCQRMQLEYKHISLLPKVESQSHGWDVTFGKTLEPYTLLQLDELDFSPKVVIVQAIDFQNQVQPEFVAKLKALRAQGANFFFYNCKNTPAELLGQRIPVPAEILTTPAMRKVSQGLLDKGITAYADGQHRTICFTRNPNEYYISSSYFQSTPAEKASENCPSYYSRDFPYWEYIYVSALKSLRYLAEISPACKAVACNSGTLEIAANSSCDITLKTVWYDLHRFVEKQSETKVTLQAGQNQIALAATGLPGGSHVVHYFLINRDNGKEYDFGAARVDTPSIATLKLTFDDQDCIFTRGGAVSGTLAIDPAPPANAILEYFTEDVDNRIAVKAQMPAAASNKFSFVVPAPNTRLNRLHFRLYIDGRDVAHAMGEFSLPTPKDIHQMDALVWLGRPAMSKVIHDVGITYSIINMGQDMETMGMLRNHANVGLGMASIGAGQVATPYKSEQAYRGDIKSDPIRKPCFSDPEHWKRVEAQITEKTSHQRYRFYDIALHEIADEAFLGASVCYSPHCLADFRQAMAKQYGSLDALNQEWGSNFAQWDDVTPCQFEDLKDKNNLAPWMDHKLFMAEVFAKNWVGNTAAILRKFIPGSKTGLSGTQIPGLSYDWAQLMKYIDCLSYYGGIQRKFVHDTAAPGFVAGAWSGGYAQAYETNEFYQKSNIWSDVLLGANFASNFAGHSVNGDLKPVRNTELYGELIKELRQGPARLVLSATEIKRDIAVLYSQPSLFTAKGSIGDNLWHNAQTAWAALLEDVKYGYFYLPYETLENEVPKTKVIVLPCTIALPDSAVENLEKFVAQGGTVIADFAPGVYDRHGKITRKPRLEKLFGIDRSSAAIEPAMKNISSALFTGEVRRAEKGLKVNDATVGTTSNDDNTPFILSKGSGRGQAILLNMIINTYQTVKLGGVGGELNTVTSGNEVFCRNLRTLVESMLRRAGAELNSVVTTTNNQPFPCNSVLKQDGENFVYAIHKHAVNNGTNVYPMLFKDQKPVALKVILPVSGCIYDIKKGKLLAKGDTFNIDLINGEGQIFSILKNDVTKVTIDAPKTATAGNPFAVTMKNDGSGAHIFFLSLLDPSGKVRTEYNHDLRGENAAATYTFAFAHNDAKGLWIIQCKNVNTGLTTSTTINLQ